MRSLVDILGVGDGVINALRSLYCCTMTNAAEFVSEVHPRPEDILPRYEVINARNSKENSSI